MSRLLSALLLAVLPSVCTAQFGSGIGGIITDPDNRAIAEAQVELTNTDTEIKQQTRSDGAGGYPLRL